MEPTAIVGGWKPPLRYYHGADMPVDQLAAASMVPQLEQTHPHMDELDRLHCKEAEWPASDEPSSLTVAASPR